MEISSSIPRHTAGRTFIVALSALGVIALGESAAVGYAFFSHRISSGVEPALPASLGKNEVPEKLTLVDPFAGAESPTPAPPARAAASPQATPEQVASLPKPTPLPVEKTTIEARLNDLVEQARALRERGDTSTALTRLREALAVAPSSPLIISELAATFEKMGQTDKALEQWRLIYDMGESAGIYYLAADAKLKAAEMPAKRDTSPTGIQPGSVLGLADITTVDAGEPGSGKKFVLKIPLKARANSSIEVKDVTIQVFFYDQIDGAIIQTNANVSSHWSTLPADWKDDDVEILEVEYAQPMSKGPKPAENRVYFGYVVRVYYKGELQDWRSDQDKLRAKYPPPLTLSASDQS